MFNNMKIKLLPALTAACFLLIFVILKMFNAYSIIFFIIALLIDHFTNIRNGIKNLIYLLSALSVYPILLGIFLLYLPFIVFGALLQEKNFIRDYLIGFSVSFIPAISIYIISTYFSLPLSLPVIFLIFYSLPLIAIALLKKNSVYSIEVSDKEAILILIVLLCTILTAINIVDDKNLFIANGSREFYRVQNAVRGLSNSGLIPIYDPGMGSGEATYLWVPPAVVTHFALANLFFKFVNPIMFFNANTLFVLFLFALSIGVFFYSIINKKSALAISSLTILDVVVISSVTVVTSLNFFILQSLESIRAFFGFPIATLLFSLILANPKRFNELLIIAYLLAVVLVVHSSFGLAVFLLAFCMFFFTKIYYFRDRTEIKQFIKWALANKLKLSIALAAISLVPLFYISTPFIFKDFLLEVPSTKLGIGNFVHAAASFFRDFSHNELSYLSLNYPDVNRIDDHKFGLFLSVFGIISLVLLMLMYRLKTIGNFRAFAFSFFAHLILLSLISIVAIRVGGFFRTPSLYLLVLSGASIVAFISILGKKSLQIISVVIVFGAFVHSFPYAQQNISNIHKEQFMRGESYKNELDFIKQLPIDGRIMTYGLFNSVIDYGVSYFTGRYGSRNEHIALQTARTPHEKVHGQNSFGEPDMVLKKSGTELYNYLRAGGYKYLFINIAHPIGAYAVSQVYPDLSYAVYQNGPLVFLIVNNTYYAEKVDIIRDLNEEIYKKRGGYKYTAISRHYNFKYDNLIKHDNLNFADIPREPEPLKFERLSAGKVKIYGSFSDGDWIVFKEQYFSRWRAYMGNKEIPVFTNNHEMILVRAIKGNEILLEYKVLPIEKIIGALSFAGFIWLSALILFLLKQ